MKRIGYGIGLLVAAAGVALLLLEWSGLKRYVKMGRM